MKRGRLRLLTGFAFVSQAIVLGWAHASPPISASIVTSFAAPSFTTLFAETIALETPTLFVPFLSLLALYPPENTTVSSPERLFNYLSELVTFSPSVSESINLSLALQEAVPRIQTHYALCDERDAGFEGGDGDCSSWVDIADRKVCSRDQFWEVLGQSQKKRSGPLHFPDGPQAPLLYPFDHLYPPSSPHLPLAILYASPLSTSFPPLLDLLQSLADSDRLRFAVRWKPDEDELANNYVVLSGYGAALNIKKSDYLAIDDRLTSTTNDDATSDTIALAQVPPHVLPNLSLLTAQAILTSSSPLSTFSALTADFPLLAPTLASELNRSIFPSAREPSESEYHPLRRQGPQFYINGLSVPVNEVEPFALVRRLRAERQLIEGLQKASYDLLTPKQARDILLYQDKGSEEKEKQDQGLPNAKQVLGERYDVSERKNEGGSIIWWNDLTKDTRYQSYPQQLSSMLQQTYPGQMPMIAQNLHQLVAVLDLGNLHALTVMTEQLRQFVSRGIPVRIGLVALVQSRAGDEMEVGEKVARVLEYVVATRGKKLAMQWLTSVAKAKLAVASAYEALKAADTSEGPGLADLEVVLGQPSRLVEHGKRWLERLGLARGISVSGTVSGAFFLNGAYFELDDEWTTSLQRILSLHTQWVQQAVYRKKLLDSIPVKKLERYWYTLDGAQPRRDRWLAQTELRIANLDLTLPKTRAEEDITEDDERLGEPLYLEAVAEPDEDEDQAERPALATVFLVADLESTQGRGMARAAFKAIDMRNDARLSFVHNPAPKSPPLHDFSFATLLYHLHYKQLTFSVLPSEVVKWIDLDLDEDGPESELDRDDWGEEDPLTKLVRVGVTGSKAPAYWKSLLPLVNSFGFQPGQSGWVINGRILGPFTEGEYGKEDIVNHAIDYELERRILPAVRAIKSTDFDASSLTSVEAANLFGHATAILAQSSLPDPAVGLFGGSTPVRDLGYRDFDNDTTAIIGERETTAVFELAVIVDPASEIGQRWSPIIETLSLLDSVHVRLYLNPARSLSAVPIKRFYRYSFEATPSFDSTGEELLPHVTFRGMPQQTLFTFSMDTQRSWLAFPRTAPYDLDNIRLSDLPASSLNEGIKAIFELEAVIVEGHAREMPNSQPPRGLQLELHNDVGTKLDTICMANLGYLQFKASPGTWRLAIRPGRNAEFYEMESAGAQGWKSGSVLDAGVVVPVTTWEGATIFPRFRRRPGFEDKDLLEESSTRTATRGLAPLLKQATSRIPFLKSYLPKSLTTASNTDRKKAVINIFTVASGHLYERMAFIMIVSVLRHTKSTVKFWFIQNFLSPAFKAFIPHMAKEYGFEYELITYKWPHWLRAQEEKQRTIWGYKILFLDVLFPLELERVIFVDSDQIVRADLKELVDLDLRGAPYAYAPMGNDREETAGFRFWDSGYWKEHLRGRPYHISALYVIDLDRFRDMAAGDRLRQQYQGLSADPNSLANLDQDLPNNMQNSLPIFTLDKDWLWCETWCASERLASAKTIDLCNNPLTHEPKLQRAKRMIPEWTIYDEEVAALAQRVAQEESASGEGQKGDVIAFGRRADDLAQAVEQKAEQKVFVGEAEDRPEVLSSEGRIPQRDEL